MLSGNASAPLSCPIAFELFWLTGTCSWMLGKFVQQFYCFFETVWLICSKIGNIFLRPFYKTYLIDHNEFSQAFISSILSKVVTFPCFACSSDSSIRL